MSDNVIYTIGHSNHALDAFIGLLSKHNINAIADVRSVPYSNFNSQFNRDFLAENLKVRDINYIFFGQELGARSENPDCYLNGQVQYDRIAASETYKHALERIISGSVEYKIALMCSEKEPLDCHRTILVARSLVDHDCIVKHILADGSIEEHETTIKRLLEMTKLAEDELLRSFDDRVDEAYKVRETKIAYAESLEDKDKHEITNEN